MRYINRTLIVFSMGLFLNYFLGVFAYAQSKNKVPLNPPPSIKSKTEISLPVIRSDVSSKVDPGVYSNLMALESELTNKKEIVLTTFGSFLGRQANNTEEVSALIKSKLEETQNFNIHICHLSVTYDQSAQEAIKCIEKLNIKPDFVISLGEGGSCDNLIFETIARNKDHEISPDNNGRIRQNHTIKELGPDRVGFSEAVSDMYCSFPPASRDITGISNDSGGFVCNNLSYLMALYLHPKKVPYTFIHIPPAECARFGYNPNSLVTTTASDLTTAFLKLFPPPPEKSLQKDFCRTLPTNLIDLSFVKNKLIEESEDDDVKACKKSFYEKYKATYVNDKGGA